MSQVPSLSAYDTVMALKNNLGSVILGKDEIIDFILVDLISSWNVLLEAVPGVGKTTLAKALAKSVAGRFNRVQFTPDLLPADIVGGSIYNPKSGEFAFHPGPIFANIILADEVNRASPRTQSALLESMTEGQATVEGVSHRLPHPFIVVATQNPVEFHGTYPLPESQLDRFIMQLKLGYPAEDKEYEILFEQNHEHPLDRLQPVMDCARIREVQAQVREVGVEASVGRYLLSLVRKTRDHTRLTLGASPRAALMLFRASQSLAFLRQRDYVIPDDVRTLAVPVLAHRIVLDSKARYAGVDKAAVIKEILESIAVPV